MKSLFLNTKIKINSFQTIKLLFIVFVVALTVFFLFTQVFDGKYFPENEDESIYYNSAKLFQETNSLKSPTCNSELRSKIGDFHWYGPGYHVIYGSFVKIFGFSNPNFIIFHFILFLLSIASVFFIPISLNQKLSFLVIFLSSFAAMPFIFTYFPESINVLLSLILMILYLKGNTKSQYLYIFIFTVLIFSLVRSTLIFWIFAILFNSKILSGFWKRILIVVVVFIFGIVCVKYLSAPTHISGFKEIHNSESTFNISNLVIGVKENLVKNIKNIYHYLFNHIFGLFSLFSFLFLVIASIHTYMFEKDNQNKQKIFGILFFTSLTLISFILLYTFDVFFIEKQIAFLVPGLIYIVINGNNKLSFILMIFVFMFFPFAFSKAKKNIEQRRESYVNVSKFNNQVDSFQSFVNHINPKYSEVNILYLYNEYELPKNLITCFLPLSKNKVPILYTQNIIDLDKPDSLKFQTHNLIRIDYVLSKNMLKLDWLDLKYSNGYIFLYSNKNND
jgi:hypothetical protein